MDNNKLIIYGLVGAIFLVIIGAIIYLLVAGKNDAPVTDAYPQSVQKAITNPVEKNENWYTLESTDKYQISYDKVDQNDSFTIVINASPALEVSLEAEQAFLKKLGVEKDYACKLPVRMSVPNSIDSNLSGYDFGLSFCLGKLHISEIAK